MIAAVLIGLGAVTSPPGGLMFALPFLFLMPGVVLAVVGGILLFIGVRRKRAASNHRTGAA